MVRTFLFLVSVLYSIALLAGQNRVSVFQKIDYSNVDFHVSMLGNDTNSGSLTDPFATISAACNAVRQSGKLAIEPNVVHIHAGIYRLNNPVVFGPDDSGSKDVSVVYIAAGDGKVAITVAQESHRRLPCGRWKHGPRARR